MYPLLPTMQRVDHVLIKQAVDELANFYREQEIVLAQQIAWMLIFLERTNTIVAEEKQKIREVVKVLDRLWDESPRVQQTFARGKAEGRAEGEARGEVKGEVKGLRLSVVTVVRVRFPALTEAAKQKVAAMTQAEALSLLLEQISTAPNEDIARWLLFPSAS